jgi:hypothetical protein
MTKVLITPWEVVRYGPVQKEYPTGYGAKHIPTKERKLFRDCLGKSLYKLMMDDVKDFTNVAEWDSKATYQEGDQVLFHGCVIESNIANNTDLPGKSSSWEPAKKFESECFNDLWELHLREYLAFEVIYTSIRYATHTASAKGLVEHFDTETGTKTVGTKALIDFKRELKDDALDRLEDMRDYIIEAYNENECTVFECVPFVKKKECGVDNSCNVSARRTRRIHFRQ